MRVESESGGLNTAGSKGAFMVIGAGPGLGAAAARRFGREGHPVGLVARNADCLKQIAADLASELPTTVPAPATEIADVTDVDALAGALRALGERLGPIEVVLFSPRPSLEWIKPVLDTEPQDVANALTLSVIAATAAVRTVVPDMRRRGGGTSRTQ